MELNTNMFDGHADKYDQWFMENDKVFMSELKLLAACIEPLKRDKVLSVGCGSGLFEASLRKEYGIEITDGLEPSKDMALIAEKRVLNVQISDIESADLKDEEYDLIYLNGCSTYFSDLEKNYQKCYKALKKGGHIVLLDVAKESAYGILYSFARHVGGYDPELFSEIAPKLPYPIELLNSAVLYTHKAIKEAVENVGFTNIRSMQTLVASPVYTNDYVEEPVEGGEKGGYVAVIAEK